ncbi:MAG: hypothetical protein JXQ75_21880 [Phycisphaerae bacterium]|nr:hypothetical protein [Phycisphaerae bacterium]
MAIGRDFTTHFSIWAVIGVLVVAGVPMVSMASRPGRHRGASDMLQQGPGVANHPVGVAPSSGIRIPEGWPLDSSGLITCRTCHYELPSSSGGTNAFLRDFDRETGASIDFCAKCHAEADYRTAASAHWIAVQVAHVGSNRGRSDRSGRSLDEGSLRCLACHDGVNASEAKYRTQWDRGVGSLGDRLRNHPVGVCYPSPSARGHDVSLRPAVLLPEEIQLPGGMVGCVSCHDLYSAGRSRLAVPIEGSRLCFTCHQMD